MTAPRILPMLNAIEMARKTAPGPGITLNPPGKRFCECCQECKPKGRYKAIKGWRCDDCRKPASVAA